MSNNHVDPVMRDILGALQVPNATVRSVMNTDANQIKAAQARIRELAIAADMSRAQALRIESLKAILEDIAPSDLESDDPSLYGMRIPQSVVIKTVMDVINSDRQFWSEMLEENFAAWVKCERDAADIAAWEDRQS